MDRVDDEQTKVIFALGYATQDEHAYLIKKEYL